MCSMLQQHLSAYAAALFRRAVPKLSADLAVVSCVEHLAAPSISGRGLHTATSHGPLRQLAAQSSPCIPAGMPKYFSRGVLRITGARAEGHEPMASCCTQASKVALGDPVKAAAGLCWSQTSTFLQTSARQIHNSAGKLVLACCLLAHQRPGCSAQAYSAATQTSCMCSKSRTGLL